MLERLELSDFEPLVGASFELRLSDGSRHSLELVEATRLGELSARQARERGLRPPFSLLFRGPADLGLAQAILEVEHAGLGKLELFLVPIDSSEKGSLFEAVFT